MTDVKGVMRCAYCALPSSLSYRIIIVGMNKESQCRRDIVMNNIMNLVAATFTIITLANITQNVKMVTQELPAISRTGIAPEDLANLVGGNFKGNTKDNKIELKPASTSIESTVPTYDPATRAVLENIYDTDNSLVAQKADLIARIATAKSKEEAIALVLGNMTTELKDELRDNLGDIDMNALAESVLGALANDQLLVVNQLAVNNTTIAAALKLTDQELSAFGEKFMPQMTATAVRIALTVQESARCFGYTVRVDTHLPAWVPDVGQGKVQGCPQRR